METVTAQEKSDKSSQQSAKKTQFNVNKTSCSDRVNSLLRYLLVKTVDLLLFLVLFLFVLAPLTVKLFPGMGKHFIYLNGLSLPSYFQDLSNPASFGLNSTKNFYLSTDKNVVIGAWHTLPKQLEGDGYKHEEYESLLARTKHPILLYCHGNAFTRSTSHRVALYKLLASLGFHVISFDYRGCGDSSGTPTFEDGLVKDAVTLYLWLREKAGPDVPIYVWGHSLGSGVGTKAVRYLNEKKEYPAGLILEAPFNSIYDVARSNPLLKVVSRLWWYEGALQTTMELNNIYFKTDENICHVDTPVLILHAEDDEIVPVELAYKLYDSSKRRPPTFPSVTLHVFPYERRLLHKYIYTAEELPSLIRTFMDDSRRN